METDPRRWLQRFEPCVLLRDEDGQLWVTDHSRMHLVPDHVTSLVDHLDVPVDGSLVLDLSAASPWPTGHPGDPHRVQDAFRALPGSAAMQVQALDATTGQAHLTNSDLQSTYLDLTAYRQAVDDGVTLWVGRGPNHLVFGAGAKSVVLAVLSPS